MPLICDLLISNPVSVVDLYKIALVSCAWMLVGMLTRCGTIITNIFLVNQFRSDTDNHWKLMTILSWTWRHFATRTKLKYINLLPVPCNGQLASVEWMDVQTAVMSISSFREQPWVRHIERLKRMVGFLASFREYKIRFCTNEPDFSNVPPIADHN